MCDHTYIKFIMLILIFQYFLCLDFVLFSRLFHKQNAPPKEGKDGADHMEFRPLEV